VQQRIRLYLVRHCDVANPHGVLYGYLPGFGLSAKGLAQAESLGQRLAGQPVRMIRTSPLERGSPDDLDHRPASRQPRGHR
jgi:broad specificity phosphatase PhoE